MHISSEGRVLPRALCTDYQVKGIIDMNEKEIGVDKTLYEQQESKLSEQSAAFIENWIARCRIWTRSWIVLIWSWG